MANRKISEFTALTAPASGDTFAILDVDATGSETNKKITYANVLGKAPDGSAAAPAFSFNSDTNSGISGGSDTLVLSTGGTAAISIDSSQNVTLSANLTVSGTTTTIDTTTLTVKDKNIEIAKGNGNDAAVDGAGITIDSTEGDKTWNWVDSTDAWTSSEHIDLASGKVLKVAGTQVLSATNFTGTSAVATAVTVADESSDTSCNVLFATAATGNLAPKSGTNLTFNSDTGALTATSFVGALTGNVTGNASGSSGSCTGNAATATALATARNIGGVSFDGTSAITLPGVNASGTQDTSGTAAVATAITIADESSDTTCNVLFVTAATGDLPPKSGTNLTFNSSSGVLTATGFAGDITGNVTGNTSGSSGSCTGNAATATEATNVTAVGNNTTNTAYRVPFLSAATGTSQLQTDNADGMSYNPSSGLLTSTSFAGALTGNVTGNCSGTAATVTGATQSNITAVGTLSSLASGAITTTDNLSVDNAKEVRFYEADSNGSAYVGIKGATDKGSEASYTVSLPADAPTANQILKADASTPTNLTWATDSGGIPDTGGTFTGKVTHNYTSSLRVPVGTTGQRDGSPSNGDFRYNSTNSKFEGYQGGSWGEIGGGATGAADLLDIASSSGTGGGGATFDGSRYRFKLVTHGTSDAVTPANAEILRVSINGVMQKPNDGSGQGDMSEGYVVSGTDIIFDSAPASGASYFIVNMGTQIAIGNATTFTVADESSDTTCFPLFATAATGDLAPKSGSNLAFNSATGALTATSFVGDGSTLTGIASTSLDGCGYQNDQTISAGTYSVAAGKGMHSVGPITNNGTVTVSGVWVIS